jgi:hypothetical protein
MVKWGWMRSINEVIINEENMPLLQSGPSPPMTISALAVNFGLSKASLRKCDTRIMQGGKK